MNVSCRSDGKEEKSEGEGKDGKGEMLGIIVSLYISCETVREKLSNLFLFLLIKSSLDPNKINVVWQGAMRGR